MPMRRPSPPETVFGWAGARWAGTRAAALFALDATLGLIVRTTTQPLVGQMRLTWWHAALEALGRGEVPTHPVLAALARTDVAASRAAAMVDGWELLLDADAPDDAGLATYAAARGATLFALASGMDMPPLAAAGEGWALVDLAANVADPALAGRALGLAHGRFGTAFADRWRLARAYGALANDARAAAAGQGDAGAPRRAALALRFRLTGR